MKYYSEHELRSVNLETNAELAKLTRGENMKSESFTASNLRYALVILFLINTVNYMDRMILAVLSQSIKEDMGLSDTQLGLLTGTAFALFYAVMGLPIARWADRGVRKNIMTLAMTVWSGMTLLTSFAQSYTSLLVARFCVGIGEAGCIPTAHSMISDLYPKEKRALALAIFSTGMTVGVAAGFSIGGWIGQTYGWRTAFFVLGLPGLLLAVITYFTLIEPKRGQHDGMANVQPGNAAEVFHYIRQNKSYLNILAGSIFGMFMIYGIIQWAPAFFIRLHGMTTAQVGVWFGFAYGGGQFIGMLVGGQFANYLMIKDERWIVWISGIAYIACAPVFILALLMPDKNTAFVFIFLGSGLFGVAIGPQMAAMMSVMPPNMRATASAIAMFSISLLGIGLAPLVIGYASDLLSPVYGDNALRYAMIGTAFVAILAGYNFLLAARSVRSDMRLHGTNGA